MLQVRPQSTNSTICGTGFAFLVLTLFFTQITFQFVTQSPQINEISVDSSDTAHDLPPVALTVNLPDMPEGELLRYMLPEFSWSSIHDGFTNRTNEKQILRDEFVEFGAACNLKAGYRIAFPEDHGSAVWPVFCIKDPGSALKLRGRFGDKVWSFLQVKLNRCTAENLKHLPAALRKEFNRTGGENATCASEEEVAVLLGGAGWGINVWFKFDREAWSNGLKERWKTLPPEGMLPSKQGWAWHVYERLAPNISLTTNLNLKYNRAEVNNPLNPFTALFSEKPKVHEWFSFDNHVSSPSGTTSADFVQQPFFSAILRVAQVKRLLQVRYKNVQQMISEISGSWALALALGALVTRALQHLSGGAPSANAPDQTGALSRLLEAPWLDAWVNEQQATYLAGSATEQGSSDVGERAGGLRLHHQGEQRKPGADVANGECYNEAIAVALEDLEAALPNKGGGASPRVHPSAPA